MEVPPRARAPNIGKISHHSIELNWEDAYQRLSEVFSKKEDGRIKVEVECSAKNKRDDRNLMYAGFGSCCTGTDLEAETEYNLRIRFGNKNGFGEWSVWIPVATKKQPLCGADIHRAVRMEKLSSLIEILEEKIANIEAQDDHGFTPLQKASIEGKLDMVEVLLEYGAETESKSDAGKTALMCAVYKDQVKVMNHLISHGANLETKDKNGMTALHAAIDCEKLSATACLLKNAADVNAVDDKLLWTPLHRIAGLKNNGNTKLAELLIKHKAIVDARDRDQKTPLMLAATNGHSELTRLLLESGADYELKNQLGHNTIELADANDRKMVKSEIEKFKTKRALENELQAKPPAKLNWI